MNKLIKVESKDGMLVVSSREVAENFNKQHIHIMEAIRNTETSIENSTHLFIPNKYNDSYGRSQNEYLLTRDGLSLLVMGFTGAKALEWKLKYIDVFNKMERELTSPKKLPAMDLLKLQYEVLGEHDERLNYLENNMTVDYAQQRKLQDKAKGRAIKALGGIKSPSYRDRSISSKTFSAIWKDYKDYFQLGSYKDTARVEFDKAIDYLSNWKVPGRLLREIEDCNNQIGIDI